MHKILYNQAKLVSEISRILISNDIINVNNKDNGHNCNNDQPIHLTNRRSSMRKVSLSIQEGKVFDINTLPSNLKQEFYDEQNS